MKALVIILGLLAVLFAYLLFQKGSALTAAEERLSTNELAHTNLIKQLHTELVLTNLSASDVRSNLQYHLDVRTAHLNIFSNRLVQANLLLQASHEEARAAQAELRELTASNAFLVAHQEDLARQLTAVPRLQDQVTSARLQTRVVTDERDELAGEVQSLRLEYAEILRRLDDVAFLRAQMGKAEDAAKLRKKVAYGSLSSSDRRLPLELQPDGSVRPMAPPKP